jgi:hypothetical protein
MGMGLGRCDTYRTPHAKRLADDPLDIGWSSDHLVILWVFFQSDNKNACELILGASKI